MQIQRERITAALDALSSGLQPFVERQLREVYGEAWLDAAQQSFREGRGSGQPRGEALRWDAHALLTILWDQWNSVFRRSLGLLERSLVCELREFRNRWAHQEAFDFDDTYRLLDSAERLLKAVGAPQAAWVGREKRDVLRTHYSREARAAWQRARNRKKKWRDLAVYLTCGGAVMFTILQTFGPEGWVLSAIVLAIFGYLVYEKLFVTTPVFFGAHECGGCGRVIYGVECPYCDVYAVRRPQAAGDDTVKEEPRASAAASIEPDRSD